jgi:hypothetical protein
MGYIPAPLPRLKAAVKTAGSTGEAEVDRMAAMRF